MVTCPNCRSDDLDRVGEAPAGGILVKCLSCGHEWARGGHHEGSPKKTSAEEGPQPPSFFIDDDDGYVRWGERFPHGYVINTTRNPSADYLILHEASCLHITVPFERGNRWTHDYIKVCGLRKRDLVDWASTELGVKPDRCGTCQP